MKQCTIAVNSVINWSFFYCCFSIFPSNFIDCESGVTICNQFRIRRPAHATSSSSRPLDSPYPISYRYSIATKSVSPAVLRYWAQNILGSRPWPSGSCDVIPGRHFYRCSIVTKYESPPISEILDPKHIGFKPLNFLGHVTSSVTWPLDSGWVISYWWSIGPKSLSITVSEIPPQTSCAHRHNTKSSLRMRVSRDMYPLCKI